MILLDTNYLIRALVADSNESRRVRQWAMEGQTLVTAGICWYEFCCGPVTENEQRLIEALLKGEFLPLDVRVARRAADLFNATGRLRSLRVDCLVAATALEHRARLTTSNLRNFSIFRPWGLELL